MPKIQLQTIIKSTLEVCFDLSRSIDLHKLSTAHTKEEAIAGKTAGLIGLDEDVTWRATHFGISQKLTSKIVEYDRPFHFRDVQVKGAFRFFTHDHNFQLHDGFVIMEDIFVFQSPLGIFGRLIDKYVLTDYLSKLLTRRNSLIKEFAESGKGRELLNKSK